MPSLCAACADRTQKEVRYLLARLQEWDVTGEGKCSWPELLQVRCQGAAAPCAFFRVLALRAPCIQPHPICPPSARCVA